MCNAFNIFRNYGASIYAQCEAVGYGCQQVLWLYGDDHQITEVGTMNVFLHWINENGGNDHLQQTSFLFKFKAVQSRAIFSSRAIFKELTWGFFCRGGAGNTTSRWNYPPRCHTTKHPGTCSWMGTTGILTVNQNKMTYEKRFLFWKNVMFKQCKIFPGWI